MRRGLSFFLLLAPALALAALGVLMVTSTTAHHATAAFGDPQHFVVRQVIATALAAALGARSFAPAWPACCKRRRRSSWSRCSPRCGVRPRHWCEPPARAAGCTSARSPAALPRLERRLALLSRRGAAIPTISAPAARRPATGRRCNAAGNARPTVLAVLALALAFAALLVLVAQPDFSAAAVALCVTFAALAGAAFAGRRLVPRRPCCCWRWPWARHASATSAAAFTASSRPRATSAGKGFEVLALARAKANAPTARRAWDRAARAATCRRRAATTSSRVVNEELGAGPRAVVGAWAAVAAGAALAARAPAETRPPRRRGACTAALLAPAALHIAVCRGWIPSWA